MPVTLGERIRRQIEGDGPISVADYMALCLCDPLQGYYTTATPFGRTGDFITAPEISQIFGELIGVWCVAMWRNIGAPKKFNLVEMGPGRGTLMADLLRAAAIDKGFGEAGEVRLIEISEQLRQQQRQLLAASNIKVSWADSLDDIDDVPSIFIGNEFLDALPFHQYVKSGEMWLERMVGLVDGEPAFVTGSGIADPALMPADHDSAEMGTVFEISPAREAIAASITQHIEQHGGAALLIDYGHISSGFGDTFQAVEAHHYGNSLINPGKADLTSHVDFDALKRVAGLNGKVKTATLTQGKFLLEMGLLERAGLLGQGKSGLVQNDLHEVVERLAGRYAMGELFKVMMIARKECKLEGSVTT